MCRPAIGSDPGEAAGTPPAARPSLPQHCIVGIARAASLRDVEDEGPSYPGTCAYRTAADAPSLAGHSFAWRFRVPPSQIWWDDLFQGTITIRPIIVGGDFIVAREGVGPSYQLAVVVDDAAMGVNQVIRGVDLVPSTPRQILLYLALGWKGKPASAAFARRCGSRRSTPGQQTVPVSQTPLPEGIDPGSLIARLGQSLGIGEAARPIDLIGRFQSAARFLLKDAWVASAAA